jgi:N12 class adenine-specific DNA methylase
MARKYDLISELYDRTCEVVSDNPEHWQSFLKTAGRNFRLRFDEQLLVFAQKPDATAVLEMERWNRNFGRWVNRGTRGIAVFERISGNKGRLIHYFDISDTHDNPRSRPVPIWEMKPQYERDVIETLEATFGEVSDKTDLAEVIRESVDNAVDDNITDYFTEFNEYDEVNKYSDEELYSRLIKNSVSYMIMARLGIDADSYFTPQDFAAIREFNSRDTLNGIGAAVSDIAEMGLAPISRTIFALDRENRIIAENLARSYNENEINTERSQSNGRADQNQLYESGRLRASRPDDAGAAGGDTRQVGVYETELSGGTPKDNVPQPANIGQADSAFGGGSRASEEARRRTDEQDGGETGRDREAESRGYDEVGSDDEQHQKLSGGNREGTGDLRIDKAEQVQETEPAFSISNDDRFVSGDTNFNIFDEEGERREYPFFGVDEVVNEIFETTPHLKASLEEIGEYIEAYPDKNRQEEYIRSIFNDDFTEIILADNSRVGYKTYENGLLIWKGRYPSREGQRFIHWDDVAGHFNAMRMLGMLHSRVKPIPSINGQMQIIEETAGRKTPAFSFSQEIIDAVLTRGSGVSQSKMRIYEQFQKSLSKKENIAFLKDEYGWGGSSSAVPYTGVGVDHDGKGIHLHIGYGENVPRQDLKWEYVEKRIGELIKLDRYLNPKEKDSYPIWLEKEEGYREDRAKDLERREQLRKKMVEMETSAAKRVYEYKYHLGDKVYIGSSEYEILSLDDERVMLFDSNFPLFNKEMVRSDFDEKVRENPMNDHLKVVVGEVPVSPAIVNTTATDVTEEPKTLVNKYFSLRAKNPGRILIFQVGDFYEIMGDDAVRVSDDLELTLASRRNGDERVPMVGFPANRLEVNENMLLDRGYDIAIAAEDREDVFNLNSDRKEQPVNSFPVGRIEYYKADGTLDTSIEYTNPTSLRNDIIRDSPFETMSVFLYPDKDGNVMPHDFIDNLPQPLKSLEVVNNNHNLTEREVLLERAQEYIGVYMDAEFGYGEDYVLPDDLSSINLAYTTTEDEQHEITAEVNLVDFNYVTKIDDTTVRTEQYDSLKDIVDSLYSITFDDLIYVSDEEMAPFYDEPNLSDALDNTDSEQIRRELEESGIVNGQVVDPEKLNNDPFVRQVTADVEAIEQEPAETEAIAPAWEKAPREAAQSYDLHPEIPMDDRHNFNLRDNPVEQVGKKERFRRNIAAIQLLKKCQAENRFATPEEQEILSKYVGWGGIPEAFDERNSAWETEYLELSTVLTPEEYEAARESTLTAFYTPPEVTTAIYKAMEQMGFKDGNLLEPSCGIGNFIGMMPQSMENAKIYGVELDPISAGIAQQLYQKSSIAAKGFEQVTLPDSFFDGVVGNVPFGDFSVSDKKYDRHHFLIHDYFFAKSLDKLRPGGVMALVTSKGTMDKKNSSVRKYLAQRAELLGAIRLPNNTFKGNAGTEVVSDIIFLQKRDRLIDLEPEWVQTATDENGREMNAYFVNHPEMVLGEWQTVSGCFGDEDTVVPYENADLEEQLSEAITNIQGEIGVYDTLENVELDEDNSIPADPTVRNFSYTVVDDKLYFRQNSRMNPVDVSATAENRIKGMVKIRDAVRELIELQTEDYPDDTIRESQQRLNEVYDHFTKKYGLLNSRANKSAFGDDSSYCLLSALEVINENGELERKADMFTKRTIKPHKPITEVDTPSEALALSIGEKAIIDIPYMMELCNKSEEEIYNDLKGVIFLNPLYDFGNETEPKYLMADEYLSGNVREKLEVARRSAKIYPEDYTINVEALEKVQPKELSASEISVRMGSTWVPVEVVQQFMYDFLETPLWARYKVKLHYSDYTGEWNVEGKSYDSGNIKAYKTYGTDRVNAYKIIEETLNLKDVRVFDYIEDEDGKRKAVLNTKETAIAQAKQELIKQAFKDWIWENPQRREKLTKLYNEKFNSTRPREYDGSHLIFSGMNPEITLREHQKNAVAHILYGGNTLLAHAVGGGKTFEMVAAAMESKRLGLCNKSLFVVPNHLTEQWAAEFLQLYPAANILVATKKDFETANRKRFCGRIATGDYDAVIIGHSQFEKIPMSEERQIAMLQKQRDEVLKGIVEAKSNNGDYFSVKQLEKTKKSIEAKLNKMNDQSRKDDVVTFEELGVDRLFVDESHYYKNLFLFSKMRNVGGIAQTEAQKSSDLFMKCRYLDEITDSRGTIFATGTPISNSMVELYTIQRYLQYDKLVEDGFQNFDAWASTFGETVTAIELTPEGKGYRPKTRFSRFFNLPELMNRVKEVMDIKTADMLDLPVPEAEYHNVAVKPSPMQKEMVASLAERAEKIRKGAVDPRVDNMLNITNDGRKLALDQRIINSMLPDFEGSKVNACVENVYRTWKENRDKKSTQLIFSDLSTPKGEDEFSVYYDIRDKLVARGVPESEIKFIHEANTEVKKKELFKKVRKGEVRVLLGSTQKMGAGTNVQDLLIASHDLDVPWRPSDLEQRAGRIIRQGNTNDKVHIYRYVTEETFDAYSYQLIEGKQKFASQIMTSKSPVRSAEDVDATALSYAEIKMLATGNPEFKEKMDLDIQVSKLKLLKSNYLSQKYDLQDRIIKYYPQEIARLQSKIQGLEQDAKTAVEHPKTVDDKFTGMIIFAMTFDERLEAGIAILNACKAMKSPDPIALGEYRGFKTELYFDTFERTYNVRIKGHTSKVVPLGDDAGGIITRIDNGIDKFAQSIETCKNELENVQKQFETAKVEVEKPFLQEEELSTKSARLAELNAKLSTDKPDNEIMSDDRDTGDNAPNMKHFRGTER